LALKRLKTGESTESAVTSTSCADLDSSKSFEPFDLLMDEKFVKQLCPCQECAKTYSKLKKHIEAIENMSPDDKKL
jgi:hypothetical protein